MPTTSPELTWEIAATPAHVAEVEALAAAAAAVDGTAPLSEQVLRQLRHPRHSAAQHLLARGAGWRARRVRPARPHRHHPGRGARPRRRAGRAPRPPAPRDRFRPPRRAARPGSGRCGCGRTVRCPPRPPSPPAPGSRRSASCGGCAATSTSRCPTRRCPTASGSGPSRWARTRPSCCASTTPRSHGTPSRVAGRSTTSPSARPSRGSTRTACCWPSTSPRRSTCWGSTGRRCTPRAPARRTRSAPVGEVYVLGVDPAAQGRTARPGAHPRRARASARPRVGRRRALRRGRQRRRRPALPRPRLRALQRGRVVPALTRHPASPLITGGACRPSRRRPCSSSVYLDGDRVHRVRLPSGSSGRSRHRATAKSGLHGGIYSVKNQRHVARARVAAAGVVAGVLLAGCGAANESGSCRWRRTERGRHRTERHDLRARARAPSRPPCRPGSPASQARTPTRPSTTTPPAPARAHPVHLRWRRLRRQRRLPQGGRAHQGAGPLRRRRRRGPGLHLADRGGLQPPGCHGPAALARRPIAGIFDGKITNWNDPAIAADNPGKTLPDRRSPRCTARTSRAPPRTSPTT